MTQPGRGLPFLWRALALAAAAWGPGIAAAAEPDWPHWRGPARNDLSAEPSGYRGGAWLVEKPVWTADTGEGASSPLIAGGRLYAFGWREKENRVACLDTATGKELWSQRYPAPRYARHATGDEGFYSGPTATPEFDAATGLLYTLGTDGDLHAWNTQQQGQVVWSVNLYERYRAPQRPKVGRSGRRDYGYTTAPLVHGEWLLVEVGGPQGNLVAFDKRRGVEVWRSKNAAPAGHTGGLAPLTVEGVPCVAVLTHAGLHVARLDAARAGETVAEYPWETDFANNIATPAIQGDLALITSAYNHGQLCLLRITLAGATKIWEQPFPSKTCSPVIFGQHIYLAWNRLRCLELATGKLVWDGGPAGDAGSLLVTGDGRLVAQVGKGEIVFAETAERSPNGYRELSRLRNQFATDPWPHIVFAGGRVFSRDRQGTLRVFAVWQE